LYIRFPAQTAPQSDRLLGTLAAVVEALAPRLNRVVMSESYRMYPDSTAASGPLTGDDSLSQEARIFATVLRDLHF
ncbi:MAG: hypothetical protein ACP5PN_11310, partial [Steroidobacteraceae bacterium]